MYNNTVSHIMCLLPKDWEHQNALSLIKGRNFVIRYFCYTIACCITSCTYIDINIPQSYYFLCYLKGFVNPR